MTARDSFGPLPRGINHVGLTVPDLDAALALVDRAGPDVGILCACDEWSRQHSDGDEEITTHDEGDEFRKRAQTGRFHCLSAEGTILHSVNIAAFNGVIE